MLHKFSVGETPQGRSETRRQMQRLWSVVVGARSMLRQGIRRSRQLRRRAAVVVAVAQHVHQRLFIWSSVRCLTTASRR